MNRGRGERNFTSNGSNGRTPTILLVGTLGILLLAGALYLVGRYAPSSAKAPQQPLAMGAAEQEYVSQIQFLEPQLARASNFLNQEITFVFGAVQNNSTRAIRQIEVVLEFHDLFDQVVLRDQQRLFSATAPPLTPHERRDFQLAYEAVPAQWNQVYPTMRITGLALE